MKKIQLSNQNNIQVICFENFKYEFDSVLKLISFDIEIKLKKLYFKSSLNAEQLDFIFLSKDLNRLNTENKGICTFNPIGERIFLRFTIIKDLILRIELEVKDEEYLSSFSTSFNSNISYLSDLIECINLVSDNE